MVDQQHIMTPEDIILSLALAIVGAYATLECATIARRKVVERECVLWLAAAAVVFGYACIFTMHFVGMAAVRIVDPVTGTRHHLQFAPIYIFFSTPFVSLGCFVGMYLLRHETRESMLTTGKLRLALAGLFTAVGVGIMHYMGLLSMCGEFKLMVHYGLVAVTVVVAVVFCTVGMFIIFAFRGIKQRFFASVVIGGAVTIVHNVGMQGLTFEYTGEHTCAYTGRVHDQVDALTLEVCITAVAAIICLVLQAITSQNDNDYFRDISLAISTRVDKDDLHRLSRALTLGALTAGGSKLALSRGSLIPQSIVGTPMSSDAKVVVQVLDALLPGGDLFCAHRDLDEVAENIARERQTLRELRSSAPALGVQRNSLFPVNLLSPGRRRTTAGTAATESMALAVSVPESVSSRCLGQGLGADLHLNPNTSGKDNFHGCNIAPSDVVVIVDVPESEGDKTRMMDSANQ
eukprot:m.50461 g.50461  ORF g.50461 m.50461 type:complete len:461 (+) comp12908_c0_seq1:104-1486(+)